MAEPNPSNVAPWYLRDVCQALELDTLTGNVFMRTGIQGNVYITGPVTVPAGITIVGGNSNVAVTSLPAITGNVGILGNVNVTQGTVPWSITGNVTGNVGILGNIAGITALPPITGNVNANVTGNVGILGNVNVTQGTSPWSISGNVTTLGVSNVALDGSNLDAFGRLRISNPFTLFDSALSGERRYDYSTATVGAGNVTFDYNANVRNLNVDGVSGSSVIRESMVVLPYQPGKSLLIMNSFRMAPAAVGLQQRVGFFGAQNGIYFEQSNATPNFVIRSSSSGALVEERVSQALWNGDRLDGTGPSGLTLDTTATQIEWIDVEWLGVGSVRCGFIINGQFILCHTFNHANDPTYQTTYMGSAILPIRYEITNVGATGVSSTFKQICSTVISEGGYDQAAATYAAGTGINDIRLAATGTYYPIASIRLNSSYLNSVVKISQVDIMSPTVNYYRWAILKNATLTGATWASPSSTNRVDCDTAATAVSGGTEIQSGYAASRETIELGPINFYGQLGRTQTGVSDTFTLVLTANNNNADVCAQLGWREII